MTISAFKLDCGYIAKLKSGFGLDHHRAILSLFLVCGILFLSVTQVHATTVALSPVAKQQFLSATGVPLASGCIYTYAGGTTTFLATFIDSTGTIQNSDPIQLDSGGFANIWLTGAAFKFAVYSNPNGGACPGTPGGSLVLQYTVDNITTSTGTGSGAATSVVSAGANPASSGIIEMTKSDTICWRNNANSANLCLSLSGGDVITWSQSSMFLTEGGVPSGVAGLDMLVADSANHRLGMSNNGGAEALIVGPATTDTFTNKTYDTGGAGNVLKINGTQVTAVSAANATVVTLGGATSLPLTTPTIGGTTITNVPWLVWGGQIPTNSINASNTTPISSITTNGGGVTLKEFRINDNVTLSGCSPFPTYTINDNGSATAFTITLTASTSWSQTGTVNVASGHTLTLVQSAGGTSCGVTDSFNFTVAYQMQ